MKRVLLTTVCRPIGPAHGDAPSVGYELLFGQVTRAQGVFSPRATHLQFGLEYIAQNLDAPTTVLQYPSARGLIRELKKGYDYVGISFIMATFHHMKRVSALVREHAPGARIVLGGYGTVIPDEELLPHGDHVCREEGVAFMRNLLGEPPRAMPYEHPMVVSRLSAFSLPISRTGMVFAGLGCANGCDFCCTSHFFKRRHVKLLPTGQDIYDVLCRYQDEHGVDQFTILDEDFLLDKRRADQFRAAMKAGGRTFGIFCFASIRALSRFTSEELLEMGIDGLWIGYEGARSGFAKQKGRHPSELFPDLRKNGIMILASMIVGFDYQDAEVVRDELRGLLRLRPTLSQFLIYGPTPGTPYYERIAAEGRLRPELLADRLRYYKSCTGFRAMVTHAKLSGAEIEALQEECFQRDFQRLGPSIYRTVRVWLDGHLSHEHAASPSLRRKAARFGLDARRAYPLFLAGRLFAPNARVRRWLAALERRAHRALGRPTWLERAASLLVVGTALWTRFTLRLDFLQHPRLAARRLRWAQVSKSRFRLRGEPAGRARPVLRVRIERRLAEGLACVRLGGALDGRSAAALARRLRALLEQGRERLVVDLGRLERFDTPGLAELARTFRRHRQRIQLVLPSLPHAAHADLARLARILAGDRGVQPAGG